MAVIQVAKVPTSKASKRELYAMVCFYYNQYTLKDVQQLPARDLVLLIKTAQKLEATKMHNLTQIAAAPHSKGGRAVKKLAEHFKKLSKD